MGEPRYFGKASDRTLDAPIGGFPSATAAARRRPLDKLHSLEVASGSIPLFLIVSEAQPDPGATAVLVDELDHSLSLGCPFPASFDKGLRRDTKARVQSLNHLECQRSPTVEYLMDAVATADEGNEIARLKSLLVHMVFDCLNWVGKPEWIVLALPCLDQCHQHIEAIALRRAALRPHQALNAL
jgi:hypothetical protein